MGTVPNELRQDQLYFELIHTPLAVYTHTRTLLVLSQPRHFYDHFSAL